MSRALRGRTANEPVDPRDLADTADAVDPADLTDLDEPGPAVRTRRPDWFHRGHPVFFPLAGFFTGMATIIVFPGLYAAILKWVTDYKRAEELFPFVLLVFVVPVGLLVPAHTRRFARYMLVGMFGTILVVGGVGAAVVWFLLKRDT